MLLDFRLLYIFAQTYVDLYLSDKWMDRVMNTQIDR